VSARTTGWVTCALLTAILTACGNEADAPSDPGDGIATDVTDPLAAVASHFQALSERNLGAYLALLEPDPGGRSAAPGFRFYPLDTDLDDIPWLQGDSWGYADEALIMTHMFDPDFSGAEPAVEATLTDFHVLSGRDVASGLDEMTTTGLITVLTGPNQGYSADTKFIFLLADQPDGYLRIREIREVPRQSRGAESAVDPRSWGGIKARYH
jgi:hypothetical protein